MLESLRELSQFLPFSEEFTGLYGTFPGREAGDYRLRMQFLRRPADGFEWGRKPGESFN